MLFKGPRKPTPYAAQIATRNAIYMLVKQGMERAAILGYKRVPLLNAEVVLPFE
jgi:DNA-directed RNA polymerase specialized sigma24 family protein